VPFIILGLIVIIGGFFGIKRIIHGIHYVSTDNAQIETNTIPILTRTNGYIDSVLVGDYQQVKKGDLLVVIDDRELRIALQQAEADLLTAQADLLNAKAQFYNIGQNKSVANANANVQDTRLEKAKTDLKRDEALYKEGAITLKQYEDSKNNFEATSRLYTTNLEQVKLAQTQIGTAEAQIARAEAMIKMREAMIEQAKLKLSYAHIFAPADGKLGKVTLQPGQYVQPGQNLFTLVDNTQFWVIANFKETQLSKLAIGQKVEIHIDGIRKKVFAGTLASFSEATGSKFALLPPDNATGNFVKITQRVPVKIDFDNMDEVRNLVKAGMSVEVDVKVK
jgi:membrane fusion protein (multidrug efflux system)